MKVANLGHGSSPTTAAGGAAFLCGAFCALWAQNTKRNAWLWFFLGLIGSAITILVLLAKNSNDIQRKSNFDLDKFREQ